MGSGEGGEMGWSQAESLLIVSTYLVGFLWHLAATVHSLSHSSSSNCVEETQKHNNCERSHSIRFESMC